MNYRHGYHAGNFADVVKHVALVAILLHLRRKDAAFTVIDSHAGRGLYDLAGAEAIKTAEAATGIQRLARLCGDMPASLATYLSLVKQVGEGRYPGSPLVAANFLRAQDRLIAIEKQPQEFALLKQVLAPFPQARAQTGDGYVRTLKALPPLSRRGLILIDPPFEAPDEFSLLARALRDAVRKFATGIFLVWYPIKSRAQAGAFLGEVLNAGIFKAMTIETTIAAGEGKLAHAGLLLINPPYGFDAAMEDVAKLVAPRLDAVINSAWMMQ